MNKVKRYELDRDEEDACAYMMEYKNGDYDEYDDYEKLEKENESLKVGSAEVGELFLNEQQKNMKLQSEKAELISGINEIIYTYKRTISPSKLLFSIRNLETIIEKYNPQS